MEQLSKASPCFYEKTTFELTKKWSARGIHDLNRTGEESSNAEAKNDLSFMDKNMVVEAHDGRIAVGMTPTMFDVHSNGSPRMLSPDLRKESVSEENSEVQNEPGSNHRRRATERLLSLQVGSEENQIDIGSNQSVSFYFDNNTAHVPVASSPNKIETFKQQAATTRNSVVVQKPLSRS